jgi:hypothetical protein
MDNEKDRFGDTMRLVEGAKEDIYFAAQVLERLRARLRKNTAGKLEEYTLEGLLSIAVMSVAGSGWIAVNSRQLSRISAAVHWALGWIR